METENICFSKFPLKLPLLSLLVLAVLHVDSQVSALGLNIIKPISIVPIQIVLRHIFLEYKTDFEI